MKASARKTLRNLSTYVFSNKEFFYELAKIVGKGTGTIGLLYLASKLDLPITVSPCGDISTKNSVKTTLEDLDIPVPNIIFSRNSQDSAINTFLELGKVADWDSYKQRYVEKIYEIAKDCTDENTRMFAVSAINQIAKTMDWDSHRNQAVDYIFKLAKR